MREIKFRAWDTQLKRMYENYANVSGYGVHCEIARPVETQSEQHIVMQYTGLLDKNGKEIYEGDIINLLPDGYVSELATVEWDTEKASFIYRRISELELVNKQGIYVNWEPIEVIGNIYENPELLEVSDADKR